MALVSLGCAKNAVDLQVMTGNMLKAGYQLSSDQERAETVIINTCAFIASARAEAEAEIRRALELKRRGAFKRVVVTGCYPQRYPEAVAKFPGVDEWRGVPEKWVESKMPGFRLSGKAFAYLKIAEGCAHRCAFCAIPSIRGKYRSRPLKDIVKEAKALLASGCRELVVVAQDPMLYGVDLNKDLAKNDSKRVNLSKLLWKLDELDGDFWVRVLYSYPSEIDADFIDWMLRAEHSVKYVDVPIQHTDPDVLANMGRKSAIDASLAAAELLREVIPDVTLRTTVMTGFPGETKIRFERMLSDLRRMQFDHLGAFAFSPEEGTRAAKMKGRPSAKVAAEREEAVMAQQETIWQARAERLVGRTFRALVVAPGIARMESQAPDVDGVTLVDCDDVGEFINVKITEVNGFDFVAKKVKK